MFLGSHKQNGTTVLGDLTYEYDKAGNRNKVGGSFARTRIPENVPSTNYNAANQQTTFGDKTLTYDNNGNLTSITDASGTVLYSWNARNQLVGISGPNVNANFVYDGVGRREKKTINGSLTEFLYDGVNPVQETSGASVLANILTGLGIDEFLTRTDVAAGTTSSILPDALGSALALADSAGAVQTEYTYEPFGKTTTTGVSNSNSFQYTARENDGTGLYYYRARYYHPTLQRFISEDPIEFKGGDFDLYTYVHNAPLNFVDPLGLIAEKWVNCGKKSDQMKMCEAKCKDKGGVKSCQVLQGWRLETRNGREVQVIEAHAFPLCTCNCDDGNPSKPGPDPAPEPTGSARVIPFPRVIPFIPIAPVPWWWRDD